MKVFTRYLLVILLSCLSSSLQCSIPSRNTKRRVGQASSSQAIDPKRQNTSHNQNDCTPYAELKRMEYFENDNQTIKQCHNGLILRCHDTLVANGSNVYPGERVAFVDEFLESAKRFYKCQITEFIITDSVLEVIDVYFRENPMSFVYTDTFATITSDEEITVDFSKLLNSKSIYFERGKICNLMMSIKSIPNCTLTHFDIFHSKLENLNLRVIASKLAYSNKIHVSANSKQELFTNFYLRILGHFHKRTTDSESKEETSVQLFTSQQQKQKHQEWFEKEEQQQYQFNYNEEDKYRMDLTMNSKDISTYEENDFTTMTFTVLLVLIDHSSDLYYLSKAFQNSCINEVTIQFNLSFNNSEELVKILQDKKFKSLTLINDWDENESSSRILLSLPHTSLWNELTLLSCTRFSLEIIMRILKSPPPHLTKLFLIINKMKSVNFDLISIKSITKLNLQLFLLENNGFNIKRFVSMFPNLKSLFLYVPFQVVRLEISNQKLEEIKIDCFKIFEEEKLIKSSIQLTSLKYFLIEQRFGRIELIKFNGTIYSKLDIEKEPGNISWIYGVLDVGIDELLIIIQHYAKYEYLLSEEQSSKLSSFCKSQFEYLEFLFSQLTFLENNSSLDEIIQRMTDLQSLYEITVVQHNVSSD